MHHIRLVQYILEQKEQINMKIKTKFIEITPLEIPLHEKTKMLKTLEGLLSETTNYKNYQ